jgi:hypothetical protein
MPATVVVILDGEFGDRITPELGRDVWVVDSATNLAAIERLRRERPEFTVTTFRDAPPAPPEVFASLLPTIDLHHGPSSQDPPYARLEVFGVRPNHAVRRALEEVGFALSEQTSEGFVAQRKAAG